MLERGRIGSRCAFGLGQAGRDLLGGSTAVIRDGLGGYPVELQARSKALDRVAVPGAQLGRNVARVVVRRVAVSPEGESLDRLRSRAGSGPLDRRANGLLDRQPLSALDAGARDAPAPVDPFA